MENNNLQAKSKWSLMTLCWQPHYNIIITGVLHYQQRRQYQQQRTRRSPDSTSSSLMSILPSRRSTYKSWMLQLTRIRCELTHFANVFFCTPSRSSSHTPQLANLFLEQPEHQQLTLQDYGLSPVQNLLSHWDSTHGVKTHMQSGEWNVT